MSKKEEKTASIPGLKVMLGYILDTMISQGMKALEGQLTYKGKDFNLSLKEVDMKIAVTKK